jgi:hypothetical protein
MELEEMFVTVPLFENYAVSNYGTVINLNTGMELRQWHNQTHNKMKVRFYLGGSYTDFFVEDLVAEAFFVNYKPGIEVYHKNGEVQDCTVLNLSFDPKYASTSQESIERLMVDKKGRVRVKNG